MTFLDKYSYSFTAGVFAAGGSFFGKLPSFLISLMSENSNVIASVVVHFLPFVLMIICNVLNWRYFLKALQVSEQSLSATVLAAALNYLLSFMLGALFYGEPFTLLSMLGLLLILSGLWFLCGDTISPTDKKQL